ncbi:hypothetical protein U1Q18_000082 [Sarracenia purpurea var. burkii]
MAEENWAETGKGSRGVEKEKRASSSSSKLIGFKLPSSSPVSSIAKIGFAPPRSNKTDDQDGHNDGDDGEYAGLGEVSGGREIFPAVVAGVFGEEDGVGITGKASRRSTGAKMLLEVDIVTFEIVFRL